MISGVHADHGSVLWLRRLGIDTYDEPVIYMPEDCPVCRAEGWEALSRVEVTHGERAIVASIHVVTDGLLAADEASLSNAAWAMLDAIEGGSVAVAPSPPLASLSAVRAKVYGDRLEEPAIRAIIRDIAAGRYSAVHLSAFVTACAGGRLDLEETVALTRAMVDVGDRLAWPAGPIVDKHSVGGLPGNRTTMIVVPELAALGFTMPKTSSRAITSPSGTADAMETLAPVALDLPAIWRVVEREGGCIVWGGAVRLSPADDMIIRVERPLAKIGRRTRGALEHRQHVTRFERRAYATADRLAAVAAVDHEPESQRPADRQKPRLEHGGGARASNLGRGADRHVDHDVGRASRDLLRDH
jgi:thymidine phosphorylase